MTRRPTIAKTYIDLMTRYVARAAGKLEVDVRAKVVEIAKQRFTDHKCRVVVKDANNDLTEISANLLGFIDQQTDLIMTPSGSFYTPPSVREAATRKFVIVGKQERSRHKKAGLKAEADGDMLKAKAEEAFQTSKKIILNSLPGGFGSPFNPFACKAGYNSITSLARALIATAYTVAEQFVGGNFFWTSEEAVVNYIIGNLPYAPEQQTVETLFAKFELPAVTAEELFMHLFGFIKRFCPDAAKLHTLRGLIDRLTFAERQYIYYLGNLRLLVKRSGNMRARIKRMFDHTSVSGEGCTPEEATSFPEDLANMVAPGLAGEFDGLQVYQLPKSLPDVARHFAACCKQAKHELDLMFELFDVFAFSKIGIANIDDKKHAIRNTVIISDTDSVIFTVKDWVEWYTNDLDVTPEAIHISCFVILMLIRACHHALAIWCLDHGTDPGDIGIIHMKNEFFYPALILFDQKKVYAGIQQIREGLVLKKPKPDIKGAVLRSSSICKESTDLVRETIVNKLLLPSMHGQLSGAELTKHVLDTEQKIRASIERGELTYLKGFSLRTEDGYANAERSVYLYWLAWHELFAKELGEIALPAKASGAKLLKPDDQYLKWLRVNHPVTSRRLAKFLERHGKYPPFIVFESAYGQIPEAIRPLIDIRGVLVHNVRPLYLSLNAVGVNPVFHDRELLVSDLYDHWTDTPNTPSADTQQ